MSDRCQKLGTWTIRHSLNRLWSTLSRWLTWSSFLLGSSASCSPFRLLGWCLLFPGGWLVSESFYSLSGLGVTLSHVSLTYSWRGLVNPVSFRDFSQLFGVVYFVLSQQGFTVGWSVSPSRRRGCSQPSQCCDPLIQFLMLC